MELHEFNQKKAAIIQKYQDWDSYNLGFKDGNLFLSEPEASEIPLLDGSFLKAILSAAANFTGNKPWPELHVVDLGCYEGLVSFEFARQGAQRILGIDSRPANIAKAEFAGQALGLRNLEFIEDDVINLNKKKYGSFDITLCFGLLYHLPVDKIGDFLERVYEVTDGIAIIDTHVAMSDDMQFNYKDKKYHGRVYNEARDGNSRQSSTSGKESFWLTKMSLFNLIRDIGFDLAGVIPCPGKSWRGVDDRVTVVARKRQSNDKKIISPIFFKNEEDIFLERNPRVLSMHIGNIQNLNI